MSGRGGYRPNAGRRPGSKNRVSADVKARLGEWAAENIVPIADELRHEADWRARMELFWRVLDRLYGRPAQDVHLSHEGLGSSLVQIALAIGQPPQPQIEKAPDPPLVAGSITGGSDDAPEDAAIDTTLTPTSSEVTP